MDTTPATPTAPAQPRLAVDAGDVVEVVKGCRNVGGLRARDRVSVLGTRAEEGGGVSLLLAVPRSHLWPTGRCRVYVRHVNRLGDAEFNAHRGDPTQAIRLRLRRRAPVAP